MAAFGVALKPPKIGTELIFSTDNSVASVLGPGVCCAMTANWIATCKKLGRLVKTNGELSDPASFMIGQSRGELGPDGGDTTIMKNAGLTAPTPTVTSPYNIANVSLALSATPGFCFLTIHSASSGHALGTYVCAKHWDFFDPNVGLYRFASAAEFVSYLNTNIPGMYSSLSVTAKVYKFGDL